jgi:aspartate aminotransferase-like enzyme
MGKKIKLFIPGPTEVSEKTFKAFSQPMIGHRSKAFQELYGSIQPQLQQLFYTKNPVFLSTSSAWGVMEAAVRNLSRKGVLNCMNGAFADKWHDVSQACGKTAEKLEIPWGQPVTSVLLREKLQSNAFDAVTIIHNETSTGTMSPIEELAAVMKEFPHVFFIVDAVSSLSGVKIETDKLGIDVLITGSQKALALPPGLALFSVSNRALEQAKSVGQRGYYFDFLEFQKNHEKNMTPSTPSVAHIYALQSKLQDIFTEGLEERFARHRSIQKLAHEWVKKNGFELLPDPKHASVTLSCVRNTRSVDVPKLIETLKSKYACVIDGGYGKLKGQTFRISHMGDETPETIKLLLEWLDDCLKAVA